jgi:hypothetical protein
VREVVDGVDVVRTWLYPAPNRRPVERILNYTSFFPSACLRGTFLERPDVVIATSPQLLVGLSGWWISRIKRCRFVFEVRDLWPESLPASGVGSSQGALFRVLDGVASFLYRNSDRVVVVTPAFREYLVDRGRVGRERIDVVENGVDTALFRPVNDRAKARAQLGLDGWFVVAYIGTLGLAHGLDIVIRAAAKLQPLLPDVLFLLVGEGADKDRLRDLAERARLRNVRFVGQQPREQVPLWINASDVCLVWLKKAELFTTVLPSKMLEFMACGRPVVLGVDGQARRILEEAGGGVPIEPGDPEALVAAVRRLHSDPALGAALGSSGREFVMNRYSRARGARDYLEILERLCQGDRVEVARTGRDGGP